MREKLEHNYMYNFDGYTLSQLILYLPKMRIVHCFFFRHEVVYAYKEMNYSCPTDELIEEEEIHYLWETSINKTFALVFI